MKKLLYILLAITFIGCSSEEEMTDSTEVVIPLIILPKTQTSSENGWYLEYDYNGRKLIESRLWINNVYQSKIIYTYTGDLITKLEQFGETGDVVNDESNSGGSYYFYSNAGKLIERQTFYFEDGNEVISRITNYAYNPDETTTERWGDEIIIYSFSNNEITSVQTSNGVENSTSTIILDEKNNPFKNVLGYNKIDIPTFSQQNLIYYKRIYSSGITENETVMEYTYNSDNYPTTKKQITRILRSPNDYEIYEVNSAFTY
jgi:hypothetical protein